MRSGWACTVDLRRRRSRLGRPRTPSRPRSPAGVDVERHPTAKDATDLELALDAAVERGARSALVVGGHGGPPRPLPRERPALRLTPVRRATDRGPDGRRAGRRRPRPRGARRRARFPVLAPSRRRARRRRVAPTGLRFPLHRETLQPGSTRGVSNEFLASTATVSLRGGVLLAVVPNFRKDS